MKVDRRLEELPYDLSFVNHADGERVFGLVAITGRKQKCFRCGQIGHARRDCEVPFCLTCKEYGHRSGECLAMPALEELSDEEVIEMGDGVKLSVVPSGNGAGREKAKEKEGDVTETEKKEDKIEEKETVEKEKKEESEEEEKQEEEKGMKKERKRMKKERKRR